MQHKRIRHDVNNQVSDSAGNVTDRILFIEIFAGSAKLSNAAEKRGFRALSVDHSRNKHRPQHDIWLMDLSDSSSHSGLMHTLEEDVPGAMHMAPPCGTCSRARERPVPHLGENAPEPLRDERNLFGFSSLSGRDKMSIAKQHSLHLCR